MSKYSGSEDIYKDLVEESDDNWLYGLVAFAVIEEQRIEWMKHIQESTGSYPDKAAIDIWYQQQPQGSILRAKGTAEHALKNYANEVIETAIEDYKEELESSRILSEIKELKRFWPQFGVNLAGGLMATFIFSVILAVLAFVVVNDSSPIQLISDYSEELLDGK